MLQARRLQGPGLGDKMASSLPDHPVMGVPGLHILNILRQRPILRAPVAFGRFRAKLHMMSAMHGCYAVIIFLLLVVQGQRLLSNIRGWSCRGRLRNSGCVRAWVSFFAGDVQGYVGLCPHPGSWSKCRADLVRVGCEEGRYSRVDHDHARHTL